MNKIILVDDHLLFREGIKLLIENEGLGEVIAEAQNGSEFLHLLEMHTPDLVIMDIEMPIMNGLEATRRAINLYPEIKILVLTMLSDKQNYNEMVAAGAYGFVTKTSGKKEFERAISTIIGGENYFSNDLLRQIIFSIDEINPIVSKNTYDEVKLTPREQEVLLHLCAGLTIVEIADILFLSPKTIEVHRSTLLKKTNTKNTLNLVLHAIKNKIVDI